MDKTEVQTPDVGDAIPIPGTLQIHHIECLADKKELKLMKNSPYKNTDEPVFRTASYETNMYVFLLLIPGNNKVLLSLLKKTRIKVKPSISKLLFLLVVSKHRLLLETTTGSNTNLRPGKVRLSCRNSLLTYKIWTKMDLSSRFLIRKPAIHLHLAPLCTL